MYESLIHKMKVSFPVLECCYRMFGKLNDVSTDHYYQYNNEERKINFFHCSDEISLTLYSKNYSTGRDLRLYSVRIHLIKFASTTSEFSVDDNSFKLVYNPYISNDKIEFNVLLPNGDEFNFLNTITEEEHFMSSTVLDVPDYSTVLEILRIAHDLARCIEDCTLRVSVKIDESLELAEIHNLHNKMQHIAAMHEK